MSLKLRSRTNSPPNGFIWVQTETGWDNRKAAPHTVWDFSSLARELQAHRRANHKRYPWLSLDYATIERQIDEANALRVSTIPGAESYIMSGEAAAPPKTSAPSLSQKLVNVAAALKRAASGGAILLEWEKAGGKPVPKELAESRAAICVACPQNGKGDLTDWFTVPASDLIRRQLERSTKLNLSTTQDGALGTCKVCLCVMRLKVHTPMEFIGPYLSAEIKAELDPKCWQLSESVA